jgi:hypothetical protein
MCGFLAYKGAPITLDKLLYQSKNSLKDDWHIVPPNHFVIVSRDLTVAVLPITS